MKKIAIVRGKFLNVYEMQFYEPLIKKFDLIAFGSLTSYHDRFAFPVVKLLSPMDLPDFPYKMPILNRMFIDAHYLWGLENHLQQFDLVHSAETYFHYTQQALNAKHSGRIKKVIATVLENIPFNNEGIWGRRQFKERARNELDYLVALTNLTKEVLLKEGADEKKITVISHFVDTKRFYPVKRNSKKNIHILFVGRLEHYKGIFDVLESFRRLIVDNTLKSYTLRMQFVGDGSQKSTLLSQMNTFWVREQSEVTSATYLDMPMVYQGADIFVAPSKPTSTWQEQYGTMLLEAQASGLPIVTTRTGGIPENVGAAAVMVTPGDVAAITKAVKNFILDRPLREKYANQARKRAVLLHDISIGAGKLTDLYEKILST